MSLSDDDLLKIENLLNTVQSKVDSANSQIVLRDQTIAHVQDVLASTELQLQTDDDLIRRLTLPISPLVTQFRNIESMPGWIWPKGTQANTGGTGNTGTASWSYDPVAQCANAAIVPTLPKIPTALHPNYNSYFYNPLAGIDSNTGKPLPFAPLNPALGVFVYSAQYFVGADQWKFRNQDENEIRWHRGNGFRHIMASALRIGAKVPTVHIFDWTIPKPGDKWVDTGVACNMVPDAWYQIDTVWKVGLTDNTTTCAGFWIEGKFHPYNHVQPPNAYTGPNWFLASVQPDSDDAGDPFNYKVRNLNALII